MIAAEDQNIMHDTVGKWIFITGCDMHIQSDSPGIVMLDPIFLYQIIMN